MPSPLFIDLPLAPLAAAIEQHLVPALRGQPVAVGEWTVLACSPEAARLGVRAGMPVGQARRRARAVIWRPARPAVYAGFTAALWAGLRRHCVAVEQVPGHLVGDASGRALCGGPPLAVGARLAADLHATTGLAVTLGLGANRLHARLAARLAAPGDLRWLTPELVPHILAGLPATWLPAVVPAWDAQLRRLNLATVGDLQRLSLAHLRTLWGAAGVVLYAQAHGEEGDLAAGPVPDRLARDRTLAPATADPAALMAALAGLVQDGMGVVRARGLGVAVVGVALIYADGHALAGEHRLPVATDLDAPVWAAAQALWARLHRRRVAVAHLGVELAGLTSALPVGDLLAPVDEARVRRLAAAVDNIRQRYGTGAIAPAALLPVEAPP